MNKPKTDTRERILDSMQMLLVEHGPRAVTLEAVAKQAGLSKGGLLYHFGAKSELYEGLAARIKADESRYMEAARAGNAVEVFLRASEIESMDSATIWALFTSMQNNDEISAQAQADIVFVFQAWRDILTEAIGDPLLADGIRLMGDGLFLSAIAGLPVPDKQTIHAIANRMLANGSDLRVSVEPGDLVFEEGKDLPLRRE